MPGTTENDNLKQTGGLLAAANVLLWPFYYADKKLGVTASLVVTFGALFAMHEVGKEKRPVENTLHKAQSFFAPESSSAVENAYQNVVAGGAAICKESTKASAP